MSADALIRGRRDGEEIFLVVEASWGAGLDDATRARDRADLLARTGVVALPVIAGTWVTPDARRAAAQMGVWQVADGRVVPPGDEAA